MANPTNLSGLPSITKADMQANDPSRLNRTLNLLASQLQKGTSILPAPASHNSPGTAGQTTHDSSGNFFVCFATNSWARIGPDGYSNSF